MSRLRRRGFSYVLLSALHAEKFVNLPMLLHGLSRDDDIFKNFCFLSAHPHQNAVKRKIRIFEFVLNLLQQSGCDKRHQQMSAESFFLFNI